MSLNTVLLRRSNFMICVGFGVYGEIRDCLETPNVWHTVFCGCLIMSCMGDRGAENELVMERNTLVCGEYECDFL